MQAPPSPGAQPVPLDFTNPCPQLRSWLPPNLQLTPRLLPTSASKQHYVSKSFNSVQAEALAGKRPEGKRLFFLWSLPTAGSPVSVPAPSSLRGWDVKNLLPADGLYLGQKPTLPRKDEGHSSRTPDAINYGQDDGKMDGGCWGQSCLAFYL